MPAKSKEGRPGPLRVHRYHPGGYKYGFPKTLWADSRDYQSTRRPDGDGWWNGNPYSNATVDGHQTNAQGQVSIAFPRVGTQNPRRRRDHTRSRIRSFESTRHPRHRGPLGSSVMTY
ncbi:hypothetical protein BJV77DRAFT_1007504, partial [Russula vinacea]